MVKSYHDWNSQIEVWESDGRVFREPAEPDVPLMEVFAIQFVQFDGGDDRTELRGTVSVIDHLGAHTVFSSDQFQTVHLGRFDALIGGDFSKGDRPIDAEYDIFIHTDLEDKTHGELHLHSPSMYKMLKELGDDFKTRRPHHNKVEIYNTGQYGYCFMRYYDCIFRSKLAGPHASLDIRFAVYKDAVTATVQLTFLKPEMDQSDLYDSVDNVRVDVCGKVTARNTMLTDPEAYSTLFARTTYDCANLGLGDLIPLSKPSVVVPAASPLLLDLDLEYRVPSRHNSCDKFLKTKSSFQVPDLQPFESSVDITFPDANNAIAMLKVEVKWLKFKP